MKITRIARQKRNRQYVSVYLDGRYAFSLADETVARLKLKDGQEIDVASLKDVITEDEKRRAMDYALSLLGVRSRSTKELRDRLALKGISENSSHYALGRLEELGYLNDDRFAKEWTNMRRSQGKGPEFIRQELRKKGIASAVIAVILKELREDPEKEFERVKRIAEQKIRTMGVLPADILSRRLMGFLARRGFDPDIILDVLRALRAELTEDQERNQRP